MTKIRKQKRKKKFRYNVNKKKLKRKLKIGPNIQCDEVRKEWEHSKSAHCNMAEMGLVYDVNTALKIPTCKEILKESEGIVDEIMAEEASAAPKKHVVDKLEEEANAPQESKFRFSKGQVRWLSYLITKHGENYKAMSRDPKNHYQETWTQIRAKISKFKCIPVQYNEFLKSQASSSMETT